MFVAGRDELGEQVRGVSLEGEVADLGDPVRRRREQDSVVVACGDDAERSREVRLPGSERAEQHDVASFQEERA